MLLTSNPDKTTRVYLRDDAGQPDESRVCFTYRYLTCREVMRRQELADEAEAAERSADVLAKYIEAAAIGLKGWRNLTTPGGAPVPYEGTADALADALSPAALGELIGAVADAVRLAEVEAKKNSGWPSQSGPAPSVTSAGTPADA